MLEYLEEMKGTCILLADQWNLSIQSTRPIYCSDMHACIIRYICMQASFFWNIQILKFECITWWFSLRKFAWMNSVCSQVEQCLLLILIFPFCCFYIGILLIQTKQVEWSLGVSEEAREKWWNHTLGIPGFVSSGKNGCLCR